MNVKNFFPVIKSNMSSSRNPIQQPQDIKSISQFPSLDLGFDLVRERLAAQSERINTFDTKASFILGSSTVLLGTAVLIQPALSSCHSSNFFPQLTTKLLPFTPEIFHTLSFLFLIVYIFSTISAYQAYKRRGFYNVPEPEVIYKNYLVKPEHETKAADFRAMIEAYAENEIVLKKKSNWTTIALRSLIAEAVILALPLLFQFVCS